MRVSSRELLNMCEGERAYHQAKVKSTRAFSSARTESDEIVSFRFVSFLFLSLK